MKIAIPLTNGTVSPHFGHCVEFAIAEVNKDTCKVEKIERIEPPEHQPGAFPKWLAGQQVELVIAGGMGSRARMLFEEQGIQVVAGVTEDAAPEEVIGKYFGGNLEQQDVSCGH